MKVYNIKNLSSEETNDKICFTVKKAIEYLNKYLEMLDTNKIQKYGNTEVQSIERNLFENDFNLWKAYSWIEYSILRLQLKNDLNENSSLISDKKKKNTKNTDIKMVITIVNERLKGMDYDDKDIMISSLREIRDALRVILKMTVFKRESNVFR
ncbi:MAG: hypothetical protein MRJ93_01490 [Nitrososphaeraceae archaeon]|nr:hypothetical protein [Nitrososphaeraceae archaeon]